MREQTDVLAAEFYDLVGDPDTSFVEVEEEPGVNLNQLRRTWGEGPEAQAGLDAALRLGGGK